MKHPLRYHLEFAAAWLLLGLMRALPLAVASGTGGWVARVLGPRLGVSRRARSNLRKAMPELDGHAIDIIIGEVWDNLGRVAGEVAHLADFRLVDTASAPGDIELRGREHIEPYLGNDRPLLLFASHIGNWDMQALTTHLLGVDVHVVYRRANNPYMDQLIDTIRGGLVQGTIPKGSSGARQIVARLRSGRAVGLLVDQKLNDGIPVPFFGRPAMTAPALAQMALRYNVPVLPVRCERLGGPRFRVTYYPPLDVPAETDRHAAARQMMTQVNAMLEDWIRQRPGQWLWLHRRWPD